MQIMDVAANAPAEWGKMTQIQTKVPERVHEAMRREAAQLGISPATLMRIKICELFHSPGAGEAKTYTMRVSGWKEVEAYLSAKFPGMTMGDFAARAATAQMRRNALKPAQKAEAERLLGK